MIVKDKICKIQVWDTAGQERYRSITNAYYRGADAIFIIFDVTSKESFTHIVENFVNNGDAPLNIVDIFLFDKP